MVLGLHAAEEAAAPEAALLSLNGKPCASAPAELEFRPGESNVLRVAPNWDAYPHEALKASVTKVLPDGSSQELEAVVRKGASHDFALGPMTASPVYEFEAGAVYRCGYRLRISLGDTATGRPLYSAGFYQGLAAADGPGEASKSMPKAGPERLLAGTEWRVPYNPVRGTEAPLALRLSEEVLHDPDDVTVLCRLNPGACVERLACRLTITGPEGAAVFTRRIEAGPPGEWVRVKVPVAQWPEGAYRVSVSPEVEGVACGEGPSIRYQRTPPDAGAVRVSALAPWSMRRDPGRNEIAITNLQEACALWAGGRTQGWDFRLEKGLLRMECRPGAAAEPVDLRLPAQGWYAVYARAHANGCFLRVGEEGFVRPLSGTSEAREREVFVCAADLTKPPLRIIACDPEGQLTSGLAALRLVPVTEASARAFYSQTSRPPTPLYGVNDWGTWFDIPMRMQRDQFEMILATQAELGLRTIDWSVGRSWVEYHSELPGATRFPCVPLAEAAQSFTNAPFYRHRSAMIAQWDPLQEVLAGRERFNVQVWPWLAMQRHYGVNAYGGLFASRFFRENPRWWRWRKNASKPDAGLSYFFPEVRQERIDILLEVAGRGADGLLVGCCRQVPMLLYHPEMVEAYRKKTGVDPLKIDASQQEAYADWIAWRADFFTETLRGLRKGLVPLERRRRARIPVAVRIPSAGLFYNLAQGLDVEQWLREGLVDQLQLDPLEDRGGRGSHDVRPYLKLCRGTGVPVVGGVGATWMRGNEACAAALRRALGLLEAGVDGVEIYETEVLAACGGQRWALPLFGHEKQLRRFLAESNIEACYPVSAASAAYGYDNHSHWQGGWDVIGLGPSSL